MTRRRTPHTAKILAQWSSLAIAAPQVVAHRVARMANAGPLPSRSDRREFAGMVSEKPAAFAEGLQAMWLAAAQANCELFFAFSRSLLQPPGYGPATATRLAKQAGRAGLSVVSKGLAPIERKASANAKRLSGARRK